MTRTENKEITVKDWFADKVANELGKNITMCYVFAILKETEKAVYAMLNVGCCQRKTMWIPKFGLVEEDDPEESNHKVIYTDDYDKAVELFNDHWSDFV